MELVDGVAVACWRDTIYFTDSYRGRYVQMGTDTPKPQSGQDQYRWMKSLDGTALNRLTVRGYLWAPGEWRSRAGQDSQSPTYPSLTTAIAELETCLTAQKDQFIHTNDEVLYFPVQSRKADRREALRLFLAGLSPLPRRAAYAEAIATGDRLVWWDDMRSSEIIVAKDAIGRNGEICCWSNGRLWRLGEESGRLHPAQRPHVQVINVRDKPLYVSACEIATGNLGLVADDYGRQAWGIDFDPELAMTKASSEAAERHFSALVRPVDVIARCGKDLDGIVLDPNRVVCYTPRQFENDSRLQPFSWTDERYWVKGMDYKERRVWVLADLVYYPFEPGVPLHTRATSSGVAAHPDQAEARRRAYLELLERHQFLSWWYGLRAARRIEDRDRLLGTYAWSAEFASAGLILDLYDISTSDTACIMAVVMSSNLAFVAAAAGERCMAAQKAVTELVGALLPCDKVLRSDLQAEEVRTCDDHARFYQSEYGVQILKSRLEDCEAVNSDVLPRGSAPSFSEVYFVDFPAANRYGLHVVRCLAPDLLPIHFGWGREPLGLSALSHLPDRPGVPHPFA